MARHTTAVTKAFIIALKKLGLSDREVARRVTTKLQKVSHTTVANVTRNCKKGLPIDQEASRPGRRNKLTLQDARYAVICMRRSRYPNAAHVQRTSFPQISTRALQRYLHRNGLRAYHSRKVPMLKDKAQLVRFRWAAERRFWPQARWDDTVYSDESRIELFGPDGPPVHWRRPEESAYNPRYTRKAISHGGGSIFYWGCITREGVGRLIPIHGRLTAAKYTEILREGFLGTLADYKLTPSDIVFQQDRDPKHMAALTTKWLSDRKVKVLPWPAGSPDLNIIEHVWAHLKEKVRAHRPSPRNKAELWNVTHQEWKSIKPSYIAGLYDSLPRRVRAVYANRGGNTRY
ncbi:DDE superfamily endonuclease [Ceratobasidium sp. AG-Ba]|nr:DDE superfamily endonuclease [Ceratobasidium sp. AG-Ba]